MENQEKIKIKSFTDLIAWKEAHKLAIMIYKVTENFPIYSVAQGYLTE